MKATIKFKGNMGKSVNHKLYNKFIVFLQSKYPLKNDIIINFLSHRVGYMSTGARTENNELNVLVKGRLNRDVLRTLAHEWLHEYQRTILGRKMGPDIGGKNENDANAISGRLVKEFEKNYPDMEESMYE
jgi:hypothetical protein